MTPTKRQKNQAARELGLLSAAANLKKYGNSGLAARLHGSVDGLAGLLATPIKPVEDGLLKLREGAKVTVERAGLESSYWAAIVGNAGPIESLEAVEAGLISEETSRLIGAGWRWPERAIELPGGFFVISLDELSLATDEELRSILDADRLAEVRAAAQADSGVASNALPGTSIEEARAAAGRVDRPLLSAGAETLLEVLPAGSEATMKALLKRVDASRATTQRRLTELLDAGLVRRYLRAKSWIYYRQAPS